MKLSQKELTRIATNAQNYIKLYGERPSDFQPDGPPTPSETLALIEEVNEARSKASLPSLPAKPTKKKATKATKKTAKKPATKRRK